MWEQPALERAVSDIFGFHALQLGHGVLDGLSANRMPYRWLALDAEQSALPSVCAPHLKCDFDALPFPANSIDLVVLPHTLDMASDPHRTLREVERILVPEGRVVIVGFNPLSAWGLRQRLGVFGQRLGLNKSVFIPGHPALIGYHRLRDWLRLLNFEVTEVEFGVWSLPFESERALERCRYLDRIGAKWWPFLGAVYVVSAVKRVHAMRLIGLAKKTLQKQGARPVVAVSRQLPIKKDTP